MKRIIMPALGLVLSLSMVFNYAGCTSVLAAENLMDGIKAKPVDEKAIDKTFIDATADFAIKLFKSTYSPNENSLISPLSVMLSLAITANGAASVTKAEMEKLLGGEKILLDALNEYLHTLQKGLSSSDSENGNLLIANSIWLSETPNFKSNSKFLQANADYYGASIYKAPFDNSTKTDINRWVKEMTNGMIDNIVEQIDPTTVMYIINALTFDACWAKTYYLNDINQGIFTSYDGIKRTVSMMHSTESKYINSDNATGFIKDYVGGKYSFVALLPSEGLDVNDYISTLTGEEILDLIQGAKNASVSARLPKFGYDYSINMNDALTNLGMASAFAPTADFSGIGNGDFYISEVLHKTYISVDELGTKAGAVTKVAIDVKSMHFSEYSITLDRPFVYMIIDNETKVPVFIGNVMDIAK